MAFSIHNQSVAMGPLLYQGCLQLHSNPQAGSVATLEHFSKTAGRPKVLNFPLLSVPYTFCIAASKQVVHAPTSESDDPGLLSVLAIFPMPYQVSCSGPEPFYLIHARKLLF
jgi:hypothetical protein